MRYKIGLLIVVLMAALATGALFLAPFSGEPTVLRVPGVVEIQEVRLGSRVAGRVKDVLVAEGDEVRAGQELVRLDVPDLVAQQAVLRARLDEAQAEFEKVSNGPRLPERDAAVAAAQAARMRLLRIERGYRDEDKRQAASELESMQADERLAAEEFARVMKLKRQGVVSGTDYDTSVANLDRARGRVSGARARLDMMRSGSRSEDIQEARAEWRRLDAQRQLLADGSRSEDIASASARLAEARAKLAEVEVNLHESVVRAAEASIVEIIAVRPGDLVAANQSIVRVLRKADLWVKTYVPETELGKVRLGQAVRVRMDAYRDLYFQGKVVLIGSESEFTPRNIQTVDERRHQLFGVRIRIEDAQGHFKSGMAAEVVIPIERD